MLTDSDLLRKPLACVKRQETPWQILICVVFPRF